MEKRVIAVLLFSIGVIFLLYGGVLFLRQQPHDPRMLMVFAPAGVSFFAGIFLNLAWDLFGGRAGAMVSEMDPLTVVFLMVAALLAMSGLFMPEDRANQALRLAFSLATFVVGFEAGKKRKRKPAARKGTNETAQRTGRH